MKWKEKLKPRKHGESKKEIQIIAHDQNKMENTNYDYK